MLKPSSLPPINRHGSGGGCGRGSRGVERKRSCVSEQSQSHLTVSKAHKRCGREDKDMESKVDRKPYPGGWSDPCVDLLATRSLDLVAALIRTEPSTYCAMPAPPTRPSMFLSNHAQSLGQAWRLSLTTARLLRTVRDGVLTAVVCQKGCMRLIGSLNK